MNGYSTSPSTIVKDKHFKEIMETHIKICSSIMRRYDWASKVYRFFDLNSGPGIDERGRVGSPITFLRLAEKYNLCHDAKFYEKETETADLLADYVGDDGLIIRGDHHQTFPESFGMRGRNIFGMVYSDETGKIPPFDLLAECYSYPSFGKIDILIYISSANVKRALKSITSYHSKRLSELLALINKRVWIVRKPQDKHQWTFLLGTNWTQYPAFEKIGFYNITSDVGKEIMHKLDHTNEELKNGS